MVEMGFHKHYLSVIVPVYNDAENLANCLDALDKQTLDKSCFEVVVVDNGSDDDVQSVVRARPRVSLVHELRPGSYAARNKGVSVSKGDILAFTDSDCLPREDWLEKGLHSVQVKRKPGFVAGRLSFFPADPNNLTAAELWEMVNNYDAKKFVKAMNFGLTANLFVPRTVFETVGLFNPDLKSAGDYEWGNRVFGRGIDIYYDDDVIVMHPLRRTLSQLINKTRRLIGGQLDVGIIDKGNCFGNIFTGVISSAVNMYRLLRGNGLEELNRFDYKLKIVTVSFILRFVSLYEKTRLLLGGKSIR